MDIELNEREKIEEVYHDKLQKEGIVQKGHNISGERSYYKCFYDIIGNVKGKTVLEIGCSNGWLCNHLAESGAKVYGIDISGEAIKAAIKEASKYEYSKSTNFSKMAVEDMRYDNEIFDIVLGSAILHHTDMQYSAKNIYRVLKPKGRAIFVEPLNENLALKLWRKLTPWRRNATEKALLNDDLNYIRSVFPNSKYHFFGFIAIISIGLLMYFPKSNLLYYINEFFEKIDKSLQRKFASIGPHFAVVVLELIKE